MATEFITKVKRTHSCGALRASDIGKEVVLFGWVQYRRDHGGLVFIDLRDREGLTQIVFDPDLAQGGARRWPRQLRSEWVIGIRGKVRSRGMQWSKKEGKEVSATNPNLATGEVEVEVLDADHLQPSRDAALRGHRGHDRHQRGEAPASTATSTCAGRRCRRRSSPARR